MPSGQTWQLRTRLGLILLGTVIGLVALEGVLQLAALYVQQSDDAPRRFVFGPRRVVCLGDSNTYGLYLTREWAWPHQFESIWTADAALPPIQVVNLGYPGMNSSRIRNQLPAIIGALHPDLVMIMVGANDLWTMPERLDEIPPTFAMRAWRYSRVFRLFYMLAQLRGMQVEISDTIDRVGSPDDVDPALVERGEGVARIEGLELPLAWKRGNAQLSERWTENLDANLAAIATLAREEQTALVFLTYPSNRGSLYGDVINAHLRAAAEATNTPLVDVGQALEAMCPLPCPSLFFKDHHPTAQGYLRVAEVLVEQLREHPALLR